MARDTLVAASFGLRPLYLRTWKPQDKESIRVEAKEELWLPKVVDIEDMVGKESKVCTQAMAAVLNGRKMGWRDF